MDTLYRAGTKLRGFGGHVAISRIERQAKDGKTLVYMIGSLGEFSETAEDMDSMISRGILEIVEETQSPSPGEADSLSYGVLGVKQAAARAIRLSNCKSFLRSQGKSYPRICQACDLGPLHCPFAGQVITDDQIKEDAVHICVPKPPPNPAVPKITITGLAGSGKTTLARQINFALRGLGFICEIDDTADITDLALARAVARSKVEWLADRSKTQPIVIKTEPEPKPE